ncbi:symmetrical bis(5'-nucleosyl)-tetraphosphatase [Aestuariibacter halophilus]|uniref:bis(5'-nucleosyl)-tetraphosphatase (symmetrical) n=1 Tax=Fluctibacter halophilus TaxID=226011 RepID=A0ABS8GB98_9ALTE|nr:symmetrical bis(5'-nucleosyl)-tetraphosphatase [Aestuariibacter halophilus]MCC2617817.1 symmetrical bis(5'-nucleosyl)-tetraphosphatase [Aestuariibacter halophilus]
MANYVVGDIQGCYSGLRRLLDKVDFEPSKDTLWCVGDLIARGPESLETLAFLHDLGDSFATVLGNHDLHFLAIHSGLKRAKSSDLLGPLLRSPDVDTYAYWLRHQPLARRINDKLLISHAGLYPRWSFDDAIALSDEVHQQLIHEHWKVLLQGMYGNEPARWRSSLDGMDRWRFIINAFTRMRFMTDKKHLELTTKTSPSMAKAPLKPWFSYPNDKLHKGQRVVFGHWAALMGETGKKRYIALDTGYVWGNKLSMLDVESERIFRVSAVKKR